ncbi:MAG: cobalt-precorrin-5B (C(1))-methyltransferase [Cellvibrionales bacterium]|jgi:cobalt-precorrin-5B (C1)-methyltransferase|nr:cobalt-precorrin-5B (C(1))-methyltransferase [Cellvibrionales bacterium]MBK8674983.1 cobalt-precorrin-5B (C(1))-methyltransferase [Cellvibrionales bacterium]TXH50938.1 MAG: cobalt-precorrin-5B (C(1))-methyltransferase [Cellvibrionales bacterium]
MEKIPAKKRLRTGFSTGACSAAAARAAALGLVHGEVPTQVECLLANGQRVFFSIHDSSCTQSEAHAVVIKDAGDDPDATHGAHMTVHLKVLPDCENIIEFHNGAGVGLVTKPGLGLEVGGPAINPVPRKNIAENLREVASELLEQHGLSVTISVPGGEEMAKKTTNARLGILGGISILGTTGIVKPYSTSAFRASVVQGIQVAAKTGNDTVVLTTGGRTEKFTMQELPHLNDTCFIQMGDFLRYALDAAVKCKMREVVIGGMVGKLTKIAQGETITHAGRAEVDTGLLADIAATLGAPAVMCEAIRDNETARFAGEQMATINLSYEFHKALAEKVIATLLGRYPNKFQLRVLVCDFDGKKIAEAVS